MEPILEVDEPELEVTLPHKAVIQKNLKLLNVFQQKKKMAQEVYYRKNSGCSPLKRNSEKPVHERLGKKTNVKKNNRVNVLGTSVNNILPKRINNQGLNRSSKNNTSNQNGRKNNNKFSAQQRLGLIRMQAQNELIMESPQNIKIKVLNNLDNGIHRHKIILNASIQQMIKQLQTSQTSIRFTNIAPVTPQFTRLYINARFSNLS